MTHLQQHAVRLRGQAEALASYLEPPYTGPTGAISVSGMIAALIVVHHELCLGLAELMDAVSE